MVSPQDYKELSEYSGSICVCVVSWRLFWKKIDAVTAGSLAEKILLSGLFKTEKFSGAPESISCIWLLFITPRSATRISISNYLGCSDPVISALPLLKDVK